MRSFDVLEWFDRIPLLKPLSLNNRRRLAASMSALAIPGGQTLFEANQPADALYLVVHGMLAATRTDAYGRAQIVGTIGPGETIGEQALLLGLSRTATIIAQRDCELLALPRERFEALLREEPDAMLELLRQSLKRALGLPVARTRPRTVAFLPAAASDLYRQRRDALRRLIHDQGGWAWLDSETGSRLDIGQLQTLERTHVGVVYEAEAQASEWTERCLRQADARVLIADGADTPAPWPYPPTDGGLTIERPEHLVLLWAESILPGRAAQWQQLRARAKLWHCRHDADLARLLRALLGRGLALVLSGGGARGFAHLGVFDALREAGIDVDLVVGTSIGAIMGAGLALEWSAEELRERYTQAFVKTNPLGDYTLPLISISAGQRVSQRLREHFGGYDIVDTPIPFRCCSADLTAKRLRVHDRGPLWLALRATIAIPGVLPPVLSGGSALVDGGVIDNLPVEVARAEHDGPLLAIDIGSAQELPTSFDGDCLPNIYRLTVDWMRGKRWPSLAQVLTRSGTVSAVSNLRQAELLSTWIVRPDVKQVDLLNWKAMDRAAEAGRRAIEPLIPEIRARLDHPEVD